MAELDNARFPKIYQEYPTDNISPDDIILIYKPSTGQTHGILGVHVIPGTTDVSNYQWVSTATYNTDDPVLYANKWWVSLQDNNTGNLPSENAFWAQVNKVVGSALKKWSAGVYVQDDEYVIHNKILYELNPSPGTPRPYNSVNSPDVDTTNWTAITSGNQPTVRIDQMEVESDLDNVVYGYYRTPVQLSIKLFNGITTISYATALDGASPTFTARADLNAVNTYLDGLADGTDVIVEYNTNATKRTVFNVTVDNT